MTLRPSRPIRSLDEKILGLTHISYEVWMTAKNLNRLRVIENNEAIAARTGDVEWNATIESGLLHARALVEFFVPPPGKEPRLDTMTPEDFGPAWEPLPVDSFALLGSAWKPLNRHVAHLGWDRVEGRGSVPDPDKIMDAVVRVALAWRDHLAAVAAEGAMARQFRFQMLCAENVLTGVPITPIATATSTTHPPGRASGSGAASTG